MRKFHPRRPRGYALMLVVVQMTILIALWGVAYRQLAATMRLLSSLPGGTIQVDDGYKPLALALALLETGAPANDVESYTTKIITSNGPAYFLVTFLKSDEASNPDHSANENWTVSSRQIDRSELGNWGPLPGSFGP